MRATFLGAILGLSLVLGGTSAGAIPSLVPPKAPDGLTLSSRIGGASLSGRITLSGSVPWTATTKGRSERIQFLIDGNVKWTGSVAPYRYRGNPGGMLDTKRLANGTY